MQVSFDEQKVVFSGPDGEIARMPWVALQKVAIITTDKGPFECDFFWVLVGDGGGEFMIPQEAEGTGHLLARFQELPGFDHEAVIDASACTDNRTFLCWERGAGA